MKRPAMTIPAKGAAAIPEPQPVETPPPRGRAAKPVRIATTLKIRESVYAALRKASFHEERDKQDLVDEALERLLREMGYL